MANKSLSAKRVVIEYVGSRNERIYGFGLLSENGDVQQDEEETFGSLPGSSCDVLKADGTLVSHAAYRAELGLFDKADDSPA